MSNMENHTEFIRREQMASILLIVPPYLSHSRQLPLGAAYLGSFLMKKGHSVSIIDMKPLGLTYSEIKSIVENKMPDIIGISAVTVQIKGALIIAEMIKQVDKSIPVIIGGVHASSLPGEVLSNKSVDFIVIGEGEVTFSELIDNLLSTKSAFEEIKGIGFRRNNEIKITAQRPLISDLDSLPFPLWEELPLEKYSLGILGGWEKLPVFPLIGTRGCPYRCTFCASDSVFRRVYRSRSAKNIFDEITFLMKKFKAKQFDFVDDTLTINKKELIGLCDMIINAGLDIRWGCNARVDTVDEEILYKLREAGCTSIDFGIESGDPEILKSLKKGINLDQVKKAHHLAKKTGLIVTSFFMVGNPGEDWQSVEKTANFPGEIETDYPACAITTPFPGTEIYETAKKNGWIKVTDWDMYNTTPHLIQNYEPVMVNGVLSQEEILKAYYYINAKFAKIKLRTRYGRFFFFNHRFYKNEVVERIKKIKLKNYLKLVWRLFKHKI
jgi:radical SAM superfamily enzyme YgiQ (UPF0313 family)